MKKLIWFVWFSLWGQYFTRGGFKKWAAEHLTGAVFALVIFVFFNNPETRDGYSALAMPVFSIGLFGLLIIVGKGSNEDETMSLSYRLTKILPLANYEIFVVKQLGVVLSLSEWFAFGLMVLNFQVRNYSVLFSLLSAICLTIVSIIISEIQEFLALKVPLFHWTTIISVVVAICCLFVPFMIHVPFNRIILGYCVGVGLFALVFLLWLLARQEGMVTIGNKTKQQKKTREVKERTNRQSIRLAEKELSPRRMLWMKERLFLLGHQQSMWVVSLILAFVVFPWFGSNTQMLYVSTTVFFFTFVVIYGMNYFGIAEEDGMLELFAPVRAETLLGTKMSVLVIVCCFGMVLLNVIYFILYRSLDLLFAKSIWEAMLVLALLTWVSHFSSIKYYTIATSKKRVNISRLLVMRVVTMMCFRFVTFLGKLELEVGLSVRFLIIGGICIIIGLTVLGTMIKPKYFARMFEQRRTEMIQALTNK